MGDAVPGYHVVLTRSGAHVARLYSIAVDAAYRGRGIAAALLADAEAESRRAGCDVLRLEVRADNAAGIHLYETHGYRPIGRIAGYYSDGADALRYEKRLVHGAGGFERGRPSGTTLSGPRGRRRAPRRGLAALPTLHPPEGF